jgi:hypothetical protein
VHARRATAIEEIRGEFLAIDTALARIRPGDLCLILIDQIEEALEHIGRRLAEVSIKRTEAPAQQDSDKDAGPVRKKSASR